MLDYYHQNKVRLLAIADTLRDLVERVGSLHLGSEIESRVQQKLEKNTFNLVVVGEFNHGKSSLINAMLGADVLPTGVTPTTALIQELSYGPSPQAVLVSDQEQERIEFEEILKFQAGVLPASFSDARTLKLLYPAELLKHQVVLIDTPGVNDLSLQRADITYRYVSQADAVIFLLDSGQLMTESERVFLQERLIGRLTHKMIFVVTKIDLLSESEVTEALGYARQQLRRLVDEFVLLPVSASRARRGDLANSGIVELTEHLNRLIERDRAELVLRHAEADLETIARLIAKRLTAQERSLKMSRQELQRRLESLRNESANVASTRDQRRAEIRETVAGIHAAIERDVEHFSCDMQQKLEAFIEQRGSRRGAPELASFVKKNFEVWVEDEITRVAARLEQVAEHTAAIVANDARDAGERLGSLIGRSLTTDGMGAERSTFDVGAITLATFGVVGGFLMNWMVGGTLVVAMPVLAYYFRGRMEVQVRRTLIEKTSEAVKEAAEKAKHRLDQFVDEFASNLDKWVVDASDEVYREVLGAFERTLQEQREGQRRQEQLLDQCERDVHDLQQIINELQSVEQAIERHEEG